MITKVFNFAQDREFQFRAIILAVVIIFMGWQFFTVYSQKKEIVVLKQEKERKRALFLASQDHKRPVEKDRTVYRLEGTTNQDGTFQALINGAIYKVGDFVDQYKVMEITLRSSTLQNLDTSEIRKLYFDQE